MDLRSHGGDERQERTLQEVYGRCCFVVSAAGDSHGARAARSEQRRQYGLQHQRATACGTDCKRILAGLDLARAKRELTGTDFRAEESALADLCSCFGRG